MQEFRGRVAVITGAASGIGFALAERAAQEGMTVVMADVETKALESAVAALRERGAAVAAHRVDVSNEAEVEALADRVFAELGAVHLLCNNAGVISRQRPAWECSPADWQWLLGVNLWGVVHGIRSFVPRMLAGGDEGHIVNTASMAGLITGGIGTAVYDATKHAVLSLTESLYRDLLIRQTKVSASVLCPGAVSTNIFAAERNRPAALGPAEGAPPVSGVTAVLPGSAIQPEEIGRQVFDAVRANRFYVLVTQPEILEWTRMGHERMWQGKNPAVSHRLLAQRDAGHPAA
jgi:NAD(P)-dependent dehydrogenase (short-subunit alcohol dehydrogenase family)